jgi:hypothetical protein
MGKKKRLRKKSVYCCYEGNREKAFLVFLEELYGNPNISFLAVHAQGGRPDKILSNTLKECHRDKSFAWFDEDFEPEYTLSAEIRTRLIEMWKVPNIEKDAFKNCHLASLHENFNKAHSNPILIVSQPVCVESILLQVLNEPIPYAQYFPDKRKQQIADLKSKLNTKMGSATTVDEQIAFYKRELTRSQIEEKRKVIPLLDMLVSMFE